MSSKWIAASLLIFEDGQIYGKIEMSSYSQQVVEAYVRSATHKLGELKIPACFANVRASEFMVYSFEVPEGSGRRFVRGNPKLQ